MEILPQAYNHIIVRLAEGTMLSLIDDINGKLRIIVITQNTDGLNVERIHDNEVVINER